MQLDDGTTLFVVPDTVECGCGELVAAGERAGRTPEGKVVCVYCLADRQAGRGTPPRRNPSRPAARTVLPASSPDMAAPLTLTATRTRVDDTSRGRRDLVTGRRHRGPGHSGRHSRAPRGLTTFIITVVVVAGLLLGASALGGWSLPRQLFTDAPKDDPRAYAFMNRTPRGTPVTWDPCLPIRMLVNSAAAPPGADALLQEAAGRVTGASGLTLEVVGPTTQQPKWDVTARELASGRPGTARGPVLVAWTTPEQIPKLAGSVVGLGGPVFQQGSSLDRAKYIGGTVYLDGPQLTDILQRPNGHARARAVVMHELGHLVGLDHVDNDAEIMAPKGSRVTEFGMGDRAGLGLLGSGGCPYATSGSPTA